jgi:hypothetical protein
MKSMPVLVVSALAFVSSASSQNLDCKNDVIPSPALQTLFGTCSSQTVAEVTCKTDTKRIVNNGRPSKTTFAFYEPPAGYAFDATTARGVVSDGRGLHGVDASLAPDKRLYCLWGIGIGGSEAGYCEVKAHQIDFPK